MSDIATPSDLLRTHVINDKSYTYTEFIIQYRQRNIEDTENSWRDVEDVPMQYHYEDVGVRHKYDNRFRDIEKALQVISISKQLRSLNVMTNSGDKRTPMEIIDATWEYRVIQRTVTTQTTNVLICRNV